MNENFFNDLAIGKRGERLVFEALKNRGHQVEDLSDICEYWLKDIDCRLTKNDVSITMEIKNDLKSNYTGNVFVETYNRNNQKRGGEGWFCYCEADYLCFVQEEHNIAHIVKRDELIKHCWSNHYREVNSDFSRGYIVPIYKLKEYSSYYCLQLGGYDW